MRYDNTIDTASTIALFDQILIAYAYTACIYVICVNVRHDHSKFQSLLTENFAIIGERKRRKTGISWVYPDQKLDRYRRQQGN